MMLHFKAEGFEKAYNTLELLTLPPRLKRLYLSRLGRLAIAQAKKNIKDQKTVSGTAMKPRRRQAPAERLVHHRDKSTGTKKGRKKMLADMVTGKWLGVKVGEREANVCFFRNTGYVAWRHQYGGEELYRRKVNARFPQADYEKKCDDQQALELVKAGLRQNGKLVSKDWIKQHITVGHAVNLLERVKKSWTVSTPARPFLGANAIQIQQWGNVVQKSLLERFRAKRYQHLLT